MNKKKHCVVCKSVITEIRGKLMGTVVRLPGKKKYIFLCSRCQSKLRKDVGDRNIKKTVIADYR